MHCTSLHCHYGNRVKEMKSCKFKSLYHCEHTKKCELSKFLSTSYSVKMCLWNTLPTNEAKVTGSSSQGDQSWSHLKVLAIRSTCTKWEHIIKSYWLGSGQGTNRCTGLRQYVPHHLIGSTKNLIVTHLCPLLFNSMPLLNRVADLHNCQTGVFGPMTEKLMYNA